MKAVKITGPWMLGALGLLAIAPASAGSPSAASPDVHRVFDIMRSGSKIGTDTFDIARQGDMTTVKIKTHIVVTILYVKVYHLDHEETESFKGSQLVSFEAKTDDNGTDHEITAAQSGGKLALTVDGEKKDLPKSTVPASVWNADVSGKPQLFDPRSGKVMANKVKDLGEETVEVQGAPQQLHHLKLVGEFPRDLWFDKDGLAKLTLLGTDRSLISSEMSLSTASR